MKVFHFKTEQRLQKICLVSGIIFVNSLCASVKSGKLIHSRHMFIHMTVTADMSIMEVWYLLHQLAQRNQSYHVSAMLLLLLVVVVVFFFRLLLFPQIVKESSDMQPVQDQKCQWHSCKNGQVHFPCFPFNTPSVHFPI